jgi:hypothetical protein
MRKMTKIEFCGHELIKDFVSFLLVASQLISVVRRLPLPLVMQKAKAIHKKIGTDRIPPAYLLKD